jgi:hypothetical protein
MLKHPRKSFSTPTPAYDTEESHGAHPQWPCSMEAILCDFN